LRGADLYGADLHGADLRVAAGKIFGLLTLTAMLVVMPVMFIVMHPLPSCLTKEGVCLMINLHPQQ